MSCRFSCRLVHGCFGRGGIVAEGDRISEGNRRRSGIAPGESRRRRCRTRSPGQAGESRRVRPAQECFRHPPLHRDAQLPARISGRPKHAHSARGRLRGVVPDRGGKSDCAARFSQSGRRALSQLDEANEMTPKALFFDVFGTLVDWRTSIARETERLLAPLGLKLDWLDFASAWRREYQPALEEVRAGRIPFSKLDVLHRYNLERILPRFEVRGVSEPVLADLNLAWHLLDAWPDVSAGL